MEARFSTVRFLPMVSRAASTSRFSEYPAPHITAHIEWVRSRLKRFRDRS
jgi:hypothetical protein